MRLYKVQETTLIGKNTLLLTLTPKRKRDAFTFYPGQYAAIGFKSNGRPSPMRCFSIVSSPQHPEAVQFAMRIQGDFTRAVSELNQGDTVFLHGPFGDFAMNEEYDERVIMLAGGIGITPFISMARYAAETNLQVPMTLLYSCSNPEDIPFMEELLELEKRNPRFKVAFFITQDSVDKLQNMRRLAGRIDSKRLEELTRGQYDKFTYFICGPKQFTKTLSTTLLDNNVRSDRVITEEFTPTTTAGTPSTAPKYSINRWTYGLTGATLMLAIGFFMVLDLARFVPKMAHAQSSATINQTTQSSQAPPPTSADPSTPSASQTTPGNDQSASSQPTPPPTTSPTTSPAYSSPAPTQTYQQPVTSVS